MIKKFWLMLLVMAASVFLFSCNSSPDSRFKTYRDTQAGFSFDIPSDWNISYNQQQNAFLCVSSDSSVASRYDNCFDGYLFRLEVLQRPLDSVLLADGVYKRLDTSYITSDRISDTVPVENIRGSGWRGIYHVNVCGISCKSSGFQSATGSCEFLYFSQGDRTVGISTAGRAIDPIIRRKLISSFAFTDQ